MLRYRGLLDRVQAASVDPIHTAPRLPFGGVHLDFSHLADAPIWGVHLPQPRLERLLDERARDLGAEIRRGHELVGVSQDDAAATAEVRGPDGRYRVTGRWEVVEVAKDNAGSVAHTASYLEIDPRLVETALRYYGAYRDEIDDWIERVHTLNEREESTWRAAQEAISA
jgi:hypothetical protein